MPKKEQAQNTTLGTRKQGMRLRKEAILKAAFCEFTQKGFAMTRMEDIAAKANVSKGSIYNYFASKEVLLEALVQEHIVPVLPHDSEYLGKDTNIRNFIEKTFLKIMKEAQGDAGNLLPLIISEGERFPNIAQMYYNTVVKKLMEKTHKLMAIADARGELKNPAYKQFPQLVVAPFIQNVIWIKLFSNFQTVDFNEMLKIHFDSIFKSPEKGVDKNEK